MKILYVAKHDSGGNDDEGAVSFALESLGHKVLRVPETVDEGFLQAWCRGSDLCLFHKWYNLPLLKKIEGPKAFWYFDLVDWPSDPSLRSRCETRKRWMADVVPLVDLGFCTDGDWVERWNKKIKETNDAMEGLSDYSEKLVTLRQGADERVVGFGCERERTIDVLMVGIGKGGGTERESFVQDLRDRYGQRFVHVERGVYGRQLADLVATAKVMVCPDSPVTDRYWSNRVYVLGGFGACLLHPVVSGLGQGGYKNRKDLFQQVDNLLESSDTRNMIQKVTLECIKTKHLYRHRCEELLRVVKERLNVS